MILNMKATDIRKDFYEKIKQSINTAGEDIGVAFDIKELIIYGDNLDKKSDFKKINLFLNVKIDLDSCSEKYQIYDWDKYDGEEYDGVIDGYMDLHNSLNNKNKMNYNGTPIDIDVTISSYKESGYNDDYMTVEQYIHEKVRERIILAKEEMEVSDTPNLLNTPEAIEKFAMLAEGQLGKPETYMKKLQHELGGGVMSEQVEHIGDLTHRMSQRMYVQRGQVERSLENIIPKIKSGLISLRGGYGFEREHNENMRPSFERSYKDFNERFKSLDEYMEGELSKIEQQIKYNEEDIERKTNKINEADINKLASEIRLVYSRKKLDLEWKLEGLNKDIQSESISNKDLLLKKIDIKQIEREIEEEFKEIKQTNTDEFKESVLKNFKNKKNEEILKIKKEIIKLRTVIKSKRTTPEIFSDDFGIYEGKTKELSLKFDEIKNTGIKSNQSVSSYLDYCSNKMKNDIYVIESNLERLEKIKSACVKVECIDELLVVHFEQKSKGKIGIDELDSTKLNEELSDVFSLLRQYDAETIVELKEKINSEVDLTQKLKLKKTIVSLEQISVKLKNSECIEINLNENTKDIYKKALKFDNYIVHIDSMLNKYASLHSELTVYNQAQYDGREAAIAFGRKDFINAEVHLQSLQTMIDNETFVEVASGYNKDFDKQVVKQTKKVINKI
jgi:hypothetical protein